ncbi:MAG: ABC transporter substrate-binding protein [Bilophila sp.]|nr:ABC transporter substrate-binding protein [Bilophila sp.]
MGFTRTLAGVCMAALLCASAAGAEPVPMKTAWLGEHETFAVWYAKEKGWDKEAGLDISMLRFDSGKAIVEGILAYDWAVAGCGAVPTLTAALSDRIDIIAVANDESAANALYVRADSPILATEGANPAYPAVHGGKESVRGKEILCPKGTSAHYMTAMWLNALGLTEQDVHLKDMTATQALGAFAGGLGDAVALWAPLTYDADAKGFKPAALSRDCGVSQPVLIVANHDYAVKHPNQIEAFLKMYLRAVATLRETPPETLAPDYIRFYESWTGRKLTPELAVQDLRNHPVFTLDEQLALFDDADGKGQLRTWLADIAAFFDGIGMVRQEDRPRLERMNAVTDVYLKALR